MPTNYERAFTERPEVVDDPAPRDALVVGRPIAESHSDASA